MSKEEAVAIVQTPKYRAYHRDVVEACMVLGPPWVAGNEEWYKFFDGCSYEEEFVEGLTPEECAQTQWEALG